MSDIVADLRAYATDWRARAASIEPVLRAADEIERMRELVACLLDNDPNDMAADAVTVLDVWRKDAARVLGRAT